MKPNHIIQPTIVLIGLESVGKTALFRSLTDESTGDESNYRGSTVRVRSAPLKNQPQGLYLVDTPGIRFQDDSQTTRLALRQVQEADRLLLVVRGTHLQQEVDLLFRELGNELANHKVTLAVTFEDKSDRGLESWVSTFEARWGIPVVPVNARAMTPPQRARLQVAIAQAAPFHPIKDSQPTPGASRLAAEPSLPTREPQPTPFENARMGAWLALFSMLALFALPVYLAYQAAQILEPYVDQMIIDPATALLTPLQVGVPLLFALLVGDYGLLTLGWYSFIWALPVVLFVGISVAVTEESGLQDRITAALDPWLRRIGLTGRDLLPVLTGFGCNVVAVLQSRSCSSCTRGACVSLIAFGSACSYQIGASLSLFNVAGLPWLFAPYLLMLFVVGAIHTRIWHGQATESALLPLSDRAFLQRPTLRGIWWRVRAVMRQFLWEAMPIFLLFCLIGATLEYVGVLSLLAAGVAPLIRFFGLPAEAAPGLIFSIVRKDGLLTLNQGQGELLRQMSGGQLFILVYLASTLTACLVTLWTIRQELGWCEAFSVAGRQMLTSVVTALMLRVGWGSG